MQNSERRRAIQLTDWTSCRDPRALGVRRESSPAEKDTYYNHNKFYLPYGLSLALGLGFSIAIAALAAAANGSTVEETGVEDWEG